MKPRRVPEGVQAAVWTAGTELLVAGAGKVVVQAVERAALPGLRLMDLE